MRELQANYVVVGSGAVGMAFADIILTESEASVLIIDRYAKPGGHWNVAYPFVELHQPAAFYGVSSKELSGGRLEQGGLNDGLGELATGAQVSAYFDDVMRHQFLPTGRVQYYPSCDYQGDGHFESKISGERYSVTANKKLVDCTHLNTEVPSTHVPNFSVTDDVRFMPLNDLPKVSEAPAGYVVIGAGKTGIDACLWLLGNGVDPVAITWIVSRDTWLLDRRNTQVADEFFFETMGSYANQMESLAEAESPDALYKKLEETGYFVRIHTDVKPSMFHAATISKPEISELRRIKNVIRLGRVKSISRDQIVLDEGVVPTSPEIIHVDCSASALANIGIKTIFTGKTITPQMVRPYQPVFSAAFIAHVELSYADDDTKNRFCAPVPLPNHDTDFLRFTAVSLANQYQWNTEPALRAWIAGNRLDGPSKLLQGLKPDDAEKMQVVKRIQESVPRAAANLQRLLQQVS